MSVSARAWFSEVGEENQEDGEARTQRRGNPAGVAGGGVGDYGGGVCRKHGISQQSFYLWKKKYSGLGLSELRELRQLREENGKLKRLVADLSLDRHILQEIVAKKL